MQDGRLYSILYDHFVFRFTLLAPSPTNVEG